MASFLKAPILSFERIISHQQNEEEGAEYVLSSYDASHVSILKTPSSSSSTSSSTSKVSLALVDIQYGTVVVETDIIINEMTPVQERYQLITTPVQTITMSSDLIVLGNEIASKNNILGKVIIYNLSSKKQKEDDFASAIPSSKKKAKTPKKKLSQNKNTTTQTIYHLSLAQKDGNSSQPIGSLAASIGLNQKTNTW
eukprot:CAMPEP_0114341594 /NCGR_PEP_ID=MMETSP0101-20121206/9151_1 /TAXON_ID=38822 ORGANISM="Pteridomonas danica, Strain PT" /NCGR_SAMPLE_ID=MMETSP0101 /ASSEMBLY_ACC=CAM_ASM_000211 /LENGTH=196 /DNA_ID=CAMNT_0001475249 /DNA_START=969 /DNA_END=1556 /DNA_ORIENTATION=-